MEWGGSGDGDGARRAENQRPTFLASPKTFIAMVVTVVKSKSSATNLDMQLGCQLVPRHVPCWVGEGAVKFGEKSRRGEC